MTPTRSAVLLPIVLMACADAPPQQTVPEPVAPEPVAATSTTFDAANACGGNGPHADLGIDRSSRDSGPDVAVVTCEFYAYQGDYEVWLLPDSGDPVMALSATGMGSYDASTDTFTNFNKARGVGDCGTFTRYSIQEAGLTLTEERSRECSDTLPEDTDPSNWPLVSVNENPCGGRTTFFACPARGGKRIELCGDADGSALQYRFGPPGDPDIVLPSEPDAGAFSGGEQSWARAQATYIAVLNDGHRYTVVDKSGSGAMGEGDMNNFVGVRVDRGSEEIARVPCTGDASTWTVNLGSAVSGLAAIGYVD